MRNLKFGVKREKEPKTEQQLLLEY